MQSLSKVLGIGAILTMLISTGFFLYERFEHQRFVRELPQRPNGDEPPDSGEKRVMNTRERSEQPVLFETGTPETEKMQGETPQVPDTETLVPEVQESVVSDIVLEPVPLSLSTVELPETSSEAIIDGINWQRVAEASRDYNRFLGTDLMGQQVA